MEGLYGTDAMFSNEPSSFIWQLDCNWQLGGVGRCEATSHFLEKNEVSLLVAIANAGRYRGEIIWQTHIFRQSGIELHPRGWQPPLNLHWAEWERDYLRGWNCQSWPQPYLTLGGWVSVWHLCQNNKHNADGLDKSHSSVRPSWLCGCVSFYTMV